MGSSDGDGARPVTPSSQRPSVLAPVTPGDMAMGAVVVGARLFRRGVRAAGRISTPMVAVAIDPPFVPRRWRLNRFLEEWGRDWQRERDAVLRNGVDGATLVAANAAALVLPLVDLTPVVHDVLERLDLDAVAAQGLASLDLVAVVDRVLDELDTGEVLDRALRQVDLTEVVIDRVDLGRVVDTALDDIDLTTIVLTRADLGAIVSAALDTLDLTAIVRERVDLAGIAEEVVRDIDLPAIIQESTGSVASETVRSARLVSVDADDAISKVADRLLFRVRGRRAQSNAPLEGQIGVGDRTSLEDGSEDEP